MRVFKLTANALIAALFLAGCDKLAAFNHLQAGDYQPTIADLQYGDADRQKLDLYLPSDRTKPAPLIVWFYGGSWDSGDKAKYAFVAKRFTEMGYAVAIPDYRLVPEIRFPEFIKDGAKALAFIKQYSHDHPDRITTGPIILAGHSAGAYNAVQLVADQSYLASVGMTANDIAGIIGLSGPYDFYPYDVRATQIAFGNTHATQSQPVEQDLSHMPPLLLITGNRDHTVYPRNSIRLAELAPNTKLVIIKDTGHAGTLIALGSVLTENRAVLEPVREFLTAQTTAPISSIAAQ
ncbi:alpha/beta hydrolase [Thalassospira australica]|uniref:alpha/beta hydrolase n=1 Tax=Thalassospira australica TaxID=1528106 RepID=UPI003850C673